MLQAIIKKGGIVVEEVNAPLAKPGCILIKVSYSCVSLGTESSMIKSSGKSLWSKAKEKPDKVKKVVDKLLADGPLAMWEMVSTELNVRKPTGYSISGEVVQLGRGVSAFDIGDKVVAVGGTANHAEYVNVVAPLTFKVNEGQDMVTASSAAIGAIAMHGVRRIDLRFGEQCVVIGVGAIGLIALQLLVASGVRVCVIDVDQDKLNLASEFGAEKVMLASSSNVNEVHQWTQGHGADAVLFAAATASSEPLSQAFQMCRRKGKVVLLGVSGMDIKREDIYNKEIDFQISTSYGPGRYDANYEQKGMEYPIAYVRWTEGRNIAEYLRLLHAGTLDISRLISNVFSLREKGASAFKREGDLTLLNVLQYESEQQTVHQSIKLKEYSKPKNKLTVGLIGAGSFAKNITLPILRSLSSQYSLKTICNSSGVNAKDLGDNFEGALVVNSPQDIYQDDDIDLVIITTRHDSHGSLALGALQAGKHVFVEKPLCTTQEELAQIRDFYHENNTTAKPIITVGFNRRFSPFLEEIQKLTYSRSNPLIINYRMNAGFVPYDHWVHDDGGRIVGEGCHIIDLFNSIIDSRISSISVDPIGVQNEAIQPSDNRVITLKYVDGSIASLSYFSSGAKSLSKEYMEVHFEGKSIVMDDYKSLNGYGIDLKASTYKSPEKGHKHLLQHVADCLLNKQPRWPIQLSSLLETTAATFKIAGY